ncbi:MAG: hypothetical protein AAF192_16480 [Pseudomonadota bacterium]
MTDPAPDLDDLQGIWRRDWLRAPGIEDAETEVLWFQAGPWHVDLRLPPGLEALSGPLSGLDVNALDLVAQAEGFAGETTLERGVCAWRRKINWRGPTEGPDAGRLSWRDEALHEDGVFADYEELWRRDAPGPAEALRLTDDAGRLAILIRVGDRFALGRAAPEGMGGAPLAERLRTALAARHRAALERLFDMEFCCGRLAEEGGRIERSTLPGRAGDLAFAGDPFSGAEATLLSRSFDGRLLSAPWRPA